MSIVFVRRRNLGRGSVQGMRNHLESIGLDTLCMKTWLSPNLSLTNLLVVRWGCTASIGATQEQTLNQSNAIHLVNDKKKFRVLLQEQNPNLVPNTITDLPSTEIMSSLVVRPERHAQGRNLWVVNNLEELKNVVAPLESWYASRLIEKAAEYRVYIVSGRVATVAEKTPQDASQVAWNVHQGGRFDVVRWGSWNLEVIRVAIEAFRHSGLDFGGVDVMVEKGTGKPYILEINSAPSLPSLSDGSVSYRQKCMAKCFAYIKDNGKTWIEPEGYNRWQEVIHSAVVGDNQ